MTIVATEIGPRSCAAVAASGGLARVLAPLRRSIYLTAGDEIVWLASESGERHGRAILTSALPDRAPARGDLVRLDIDRARRWQPAVPAATPSSAAALASGARALAARVAEIGMPDGLGVLLAGRALSFPLACGVAAARELAMACAADDPERAVRAALPLLGLGPGLTPAGDDYVGGAFFARAVLRTAGASTHSGWENAATALVGAARARTHPISAALLGDLVAGDGYSALHELTVALAIRAPAVEAARRLTRIGHSSGWDILAGFVGALTGDPAGR